MSKTFSIAATCVLAVAAWQQTAALGAATGPTSWVQTGYEDFHAGELVSVALNDDGELRLAPELQVLGDASEAYVWSVVEAADGTVFAAAGADGRVYRFEAGAAAAEPTLFFDAEGTVHALAMGPDQHLYVAASPGGVIWKLPLIGGGEVSEPLARLETRYVWSLVFDDAGVLYAGTGDSGAIHRVSADGSSEVLYDSAENHVTVLAVGADGSILAGTADGGHLYRIGAGGDVFVLFDAPMKQITGIVPTDQGVFFAAIDATRGNADAAAEGTTTPGSSGDNAEGAVYLLHDDGLVEELWGSDDASPYALAATVDGVLVGTGDEGRLFGVTANRGLAALGDVDASQVTTLHRGADATIVGTSNLGRIYRLTDNVRDRGEYLSQVRDTATTSRWGRLRWRAAVPQGAAIRLFTRSGNTAEADETWSDWSAAYTDAAGSSIDSPSARFIQWKAELRRAASGETPLLQWVELVYVQRNLRPEVETFIVHPPGVIFRQSGSFEDSLPIGRLPSSVRQALEEQQGRSGSASGAGAGASFLGQAYYLQGSQTFSWAAADANGDTMRFSLGYQGVGESMWKPVATDLSETQYLWDTTTVPDGLYRVRLVATDAPSNAPGEALEGAATRELVMVDNTAPRIDNLAATGESSGFRVTGQAVDATSLIRSMQYAVDGGAWQSVLPADGMPDSGSEAVGFVTGRLEPGEHTIVVRVTDTALNSGTAKVVVTVQ